MNESMPVIGVAAYRAVRENFRKSLTNKLTSTWIMANVERYKAEGSAKALIRRLAILGLVDGEGASTDVARKWRLDESYAEACDVTLRSGSPADIVEAVPDGWSKGKNIDAPGDARSTDIPSHPAPSGEAGIAVLRYFLDRGRLAEIRIPRDLDDREKRKLFAHLKIDLPDEVIR